MPLRLDKDLAILLQCLLHAIVAALRARADGLHLDLHFLAQERFPQARVEPDTIVPFDQCHAERRGDELLDRIAPSSTSSSSWSATASPRLRQHILPFLDLCDMLRHRGIRADPVRVHETDQLGFREISRRCRLAVGDVRFRRLEDLVQDEVRQLLAAFPFLVGVHVEVVALQHDKARGEEGFITVFEFDGRGFAFGVLGTAGQEPAYDEFVDFALLVVAEGVLGYVVDWVDGRVGLVVVSAASRLLECAVQETERVACQFFRFRGFCMAALRTSEHTVPMSRPGFASQPAFVGLCLCQIDRFRCVDSLSSLCCRAPLRPVQVEQ